MNKQGILYWITGLSGAGKTTLGNALYYRLREKQDNVVLLDGDVLKKLSGDEVNYTPEARKKRAYFYARLCKTLTDQGLVVICCTIAMYEDVRVWNRVNNKSYVEVFLNPSIDILKQRDQKGLYTQYSLGNTSNIVGLDIDVDYPKNPDLTINSDGSIPINDIVNQILDYQVELSQDFERDTSYWNNYYAKVTNLNAPSPFALSIESDLIPGKSILDLGCGNGRDSSFFLSKGLFVTGIDASDSAINSLNQQYAGNDYCHFICDDFVCSPSLFMKPYDYCYSRFTIHAINENQESELIENVYNALKTNGKFYIEVRSVNDDIYGLGTPLERNAFKYNGHYRRFIVLDELLTKLKNNNFSILYAEEARDFAPFEGSNPPIIRIIAGKQQAE